MKEYLKVISLLIILIMILNIIFPVCSVYAESSDSNNIIEGTYEYSSNELKNIQIEDEFLYRDDCFTRSSFLGCSHLEILSAQLAISSASRYGQGIDKYEVDPSENAYNVIHMLNKMAFEDVETNKYYTLEKQEDSCGVAVGHKTIVASGKEYTLVAIVPRSAGYKQEWAGDFNVGDGDIHEGFKAGRDEMLRFVKKYLREKNIKGNLKVWTVGHSRGAALANMIGGFFAGGGIEYFGNDVSITPEDVYCYTYATPRTIKQGADKNIELSVAGNRTQIEYAADTEGLVYQYTKGGKVNPEDDIYNGIRNFISSPDIFPLLPPEKWGFVYYGKYIPVNHGVVSEKDMAKELESTSDFAYKKYINGGNPENFKRKTFDLKTLSIVDDNSKYSAMDMGSLLKERLDGLIYNADTNKIYHEQDYEEGLKAIAGTYGMAEMLLKDELLDYSNIVIEPLVFSYLAYASDRLQKDGIAKDENEAIAIALEELLSYFTGEEINKETFTIDNFVEIIAKYITENEHIRKLLTSKIVERVPENYKSAVFALASGFCKNNTKENPVTLEEAINEFIKACYIGAEPGCAAYENYQSPEEVRKLIYTLISFANSDLMSLFVDENYNVSGQVPFIDLIDKIKTMILSDENDDGTVATRADNSWIVMLDKMFEDLISKSEVIYNTEYKETLSKHVTNMKNNISVIRQMIMYALLYTDDGFNVEMQIKNLCTFFGNIDIIPLAHFNEVYIAYAKATKNYDCGYEDHKIEYKCTKGDKQVFNITKDDLLSFEFNIDFDTFVREGKICIDNNEVSRDCYTLSKGSTIVTFNTEYAKTLSLGKHEITASTNYGIAKAEFTISDNNSNNNDSEINIENKANNNSASKSPRTGDDIVAYVSMFVTSMIGLITTVIHIRKIKYKIK